MESVFIAILASIAYAMTHYFKKAGKEKFSVTKFLATVIVGAIVGVVMYTQNVPITEESFETQFIAYAGLVALVENVIKIIIKGVRGDK